MYTSRRRPVVLGIACALALAGRACAEVSLGGFIPFVGIGLTKEFETFDDDPNGTFFIADPAYSWGSPPLGPGASTYFDFALLDTGAATHILTQAAASSSGFSIQAEGLRGTNFQLIYGATGPVNLRINDPHGVYAAGLADRTGAGSVLTMNTAAFRGQTSVAILEAGSDWELPNIIGLPMAAQHAIAIRGDEPVIFQHTFAGEQRTVRTPQVDFLDLGTGAQQGIARRTNLRLRPSDSFLAGPLYGPSQEIGPNLEINFHNNPTAPTVVNSGGLYVEVDVSNEGNTLLDKEILFDTGADLTVFSEVFAASIGLDVVLDEPDFVLEVEAASGVVGGVPGFYVDELKIDAVGGAVILQNVPVAVLDVPNPVDPANVIDAILGMHLFNGRNLVIDAIPAATGGGASPRLYISDPVTESHTWTSNIPQTNWATAANWTEPGVPSLMWDVELRNTLVAQQFVDLNLADSTVYRLTIGASVGNQVRLQIAAGRTLTTFGETRIEEGGELLLLNGKLDAQFVNIEGGVLSGSGEVFVGSGPIHGVVRNLSGRVEPGGFAVGEIVIDGDFSSLDEATLEITLGGAAANQYDRLTVDRLAFLGGTLDVQLFGFTPTVGQTFTILTAGEAVFGEFDQLVLPSSFQWNVAYNADNVVLSVIGGELAGDFNGDGAVNAADYVVWRKNGGSQADFLLWKNHFGMTSGGGGGAVGGVPEPASALLLLAICALTSVRPLTRPVRF